MAQAATPGGPGLPCSPQQALALYQRLFRCPAGPDQLWAALRQVQGGRACPAGLELPATLLQMERSRRAQEQLLWDLELLTGAGLGLFWPPRARFCGLRDWAQGAWRQGSQPRGETGGHSEQPMRGAGDTQSQNQPLLEGRQAADPSAPDLGEAGRDADPRWESPGSPAEPTPGCLQELDPITSSSFGEPGNSEFKNLQKEESGQAEPMTQGPLPPPSGIAQEASGPSGLPSQGLSESQDPPEGFGWILDQDRAELQKLLGIEIPQRQREEGPQGQGGEAPLRENTVAPQGDSGEATPALRGEISAGLGWETPQGEHKDAQDQKGNSSECLGKENPPGPEVKSLQSSGGRCRTSQGWEVAQGEAPPQPQEGEVRGMPRGFCRSLEAQRPQQGERRAQLTQDTTDRRRPESAVAVSEQGTGPEAALAPQRPLAWPQLPGPGALSTGGSSKAARPGAQGREKAPAGAGAGQLEPALRRLLELHSAARLRRRQEREQQRLRVLERLRVARHRHCRVHPLGPPPGPAQLPTQDAAGQRRALRGQLEQVRRERAGRLRALGARNTHNFQQLLGPAGAEEPAPGEWRSSPSNRC